MPQQVELFSGFCVNLVFLSFAPLRGKNPRILANPRFARCEIVVCLGEWYFVCYSEGRGLSHDEKEWYEARSHLQCFLEFVRCRVEKAGPHIVPSGSSRHFFALS